MADFKVTNNNDSGKGSLRQAILDANKLLGEDRILVSGNIKLNSAIDITDSVSIINVGETRTTITQTGNDRLFYIDDGDVENWSKVNFVGISMAGGNTAESGGAIFSREDLGLFRSALYNNTSGDRGGAIYVEGGALRSNFSRFINNQARTGGGLALSLDSEAELTNSKISGNTASDFGGGIEASYGSQFTISKSEISGNTADNAGGVGAYYNSSIALVNTTVSGNTAEQSGGGIASSYDSQVEVVRSTISGNKAQANGGIGLTNSTLRAIDSEVTDNQAQDIGGIGISYYSQAQIVDSNISGNTSKVDAGGIDVSYGSSLELDNSAIANNEAAELAGGINVSLNSQVQVTDSIINDNKAKGSGGIHITDRSSLSLVDSQVSGNEASKFQGGGINVDRGSELNASNALINNNLAAKAGGGINADNSSSVNLNNSAIANNTAKIGGGISGANESSLSLADVEVTDNTATDFGGGINAYFGSQLEIDRTKVAGNAAPVVGGINIANGSSGKISNSSIEQNEAEISGGGINVYQDSQLEVFNSNITDNTNGGLQSYGENNSVTLISSPVTNNTLSNLSGEGIVEVTTQIIEAEDITDLAGYRLESSSLASGGELLSLFGENQNEVGTANFNFTGASGNYTVRIGTYDENDGAATIELAQQGELVGSIVLDQNAGSSGIAEDTRVTKVVATNISINQGDSFSLTGFEDGGEHARIDFIEFEAVNANGVGSSVIVNPDDSTETPTPEPNPAPTSEVIRWEAESADSLTGYRTEDITGASGGSVLSFVGEALGESGSASFTVGASGTYDVLLAAYDENDGAASFEVEVNGSRIGDTLVLNQDLGSNVANAQTAVSEIIAFGVSLEAGDVLTVNGFEQGSEHARLDYVELLAADAEGNF